MDNPWPALFTLGSLVLLLLLVIRWQVQPFIALLVASLTLGIVAGMPPVEVVRTMSQGIGDLLRDIAVILALGAMLGRMLEASGGAEAIAGTLIDWFGARRVSLALLLAAFLIGIPVLFNVGFLLLVPIVWRLQRQTGRSLLWYLLPMTIGLSLPHSLVPPHPGVIGAVKAFGGEQAGRVMVETIVFGTLLSLTLALIGWFVAGRFWASRQFATVPETLAGDFAEPTNRRASFGTALFVVTLPLALSLLGFGVQVAHDLGALPAFLSEPIVAGPTHPALKILGTKPIDWLRFLGDPTMALFFATGAAFWLLGGRAGFDRTRLAGIADKALGDVGAMVFLFGAAGGLKEMIRATGAGDVIANAVSQLSMSPVAAVFLVAALVRVALGSATASILTASALMAETAKTMPGRETLLVLAAAVGVTISTQPADSGFWMVKEYGNLSARDVLFKFNAMRIVTALAGLGILLLAEAMIRGG